MPVITCLLLAFLAAALPAHARRSAAQFVSSDSLPRIRIEIDSSFGFLGHAEFEIQDVAVAEQLFLYPAAPAETLGGHSYLHQHWLLGADFFDVPEVERLLKHRGVQVDFAYVADRHVRAVGSARKHEVIIFYLEAVSTFPSPVVRVQPTIAGNIPLPIARDVAERAGQSFRVVEDCSEQPRSAMKADRGRAWL